MPSLRRGSGNNEDGVLARPTRGPAPTAWDCEYPFTWDGDFVPLGGLSIGPTPADDDRSELPADRFSVTTIAPRATDPGEQTITREEYYRLRNLG